MKVSESLRPSIVLVVGVAVWAGLIVFLLLDLVADRMVVFDEDQSIFSRFSTAESYLDEIARVFDFAPNGQLSVIRVTSADCQCNVASSLHWAQLQNQYDAVAFAEMGVDELDVQSLKLVPATPMAIVINSAGTVLYAGPFSDANYCSAENSLIEAYLNKSLDLRYSPLETEGCYCQTLPN